MSSPMLLCGLVAVLIASSLAKPLEDGYTKKKEPQIKKVEFNGKIVEIPVDDVDPFHRQTPADEGYSPGAYETDMMLNKEQKEAVASADSIRSKRKATSLTSHLWPKDSAGFITVHYEFNQTEPTVLVDKASVFAAMAHWQDQACVKFVETSDPSKDMLSFFKHQGCYSYVGRQTGKQDVSIGDGCTSLGTVSHEIGHALGFYHEQSRPDRDDFVTINFPNIKTGYKGNFEKNNAINDFNLEYDYSSAMHYGPNGFNIDPSIPTILTKDPFAMSAIGQRESLSFSDFKLFNLMYKCDESCLGASPCLNKGYRNKDCNCQCPSGWSGITCQTEDNTNVPTGPVQQITLTAASGEVSSPNFDGSSAYTLSTSVMTYIKGGPGEQIHLTFDFFDLEAYDTTHSKCWDYLEIKADNVYYGQGDQYCGSTSPPTIVASEIMLSFHSDDSVAKKGFHGTYTKTTTASCPEIKQTCTSTIDLAVGCSATITSPNFPSNYPNSQQCVFIINAPAGSTIKLTMDSFDTETNFDGVNVYDMNQKFIQSFTGSSLPTPLSTPTKMFVQFISGSMVTKAGFSATLTAA